MDEALLDRVTLEIGAMALKEPVHAVLCGMGENLLRKALVLRALENLQTSSEGRISTLLVTNGSKLTADLLEHEAFRKLDAIQVSFAGFEDSYEGLYGLKYERVIANVVNMSRGLPRKLHLAAVDLDRFKPRREEFVEFWGSHGIEVTFRALHSRGGHVDDPEAYPGYFRPFEGCEVFDGIHFISSDGFVLSCCHDVESQHVVGDCNTSTLAEIIARKAELRRSGFRGFDICAKCTDFTLSRTGAGAGVPER